ncbi:MAG TPA: DJ-1/PfpI family protein [Bacteroidia bacterium]|nr:DJ-1/PfpI family protein [Bacteroidia bacterium]
MATKFVFLILPQMHLLDLAGPDQAIHEAIEYGADFEIEYCSLGKNVVSTAGLPLGKIRHYSKIKFKKNDFLFIPGSNFSYLVSGEFRKNKELFKWIQTNYLKGVNVCSICAGAFVLAESGLLNGLTCTTHFKKTRELQQMYPKLKVMENILYTDQNGIYTSAGIASGIDLTLHIIERLKGSYFAHLVARELVVYNRRNGSSAQESEMLRFRNHIHSGVHKVQDFIIDKIHQKMKLPDLAEMANMSERNFTRIFKKETQVSVNEFVTIIRKEKISELLKNPDLSKIEIANKVGLKSEKQLGRILNS